MCWRHATLPHVALACWVEVHQQCSDGVKSADARHGYSRHQLPAVTASYVSSELQVADVLCSHLPVSSHLHDLLTALSSQVATLTEELENSRGGVRDQLKEKDAKINSLIEELGNSQAMLNDKVAELAEVLLRPLH